MPPLRTCWPAAPAMVPQVPAYRAGEFCRLELPPLRAVLGDLSGLGLLVVDGHADLDPAGRPGLGAQVHAEFGIPGDRGGQVQVPHGDPRGAGLARILGAPVPSGDDRKAGSLAGLTDSPSRRGGDRPTWNDLWRLPSVAAARPLRCNRCHGCWRPMARSTNRSTPYRGDHGCRLRNATARPADQRVPAPGGVRPPKESQRC
jgi:hypothetical protein